MPYAEESLASHNEFRSLHGSPPLTLDPKLIQKSQEHANYLLSKNTFAHSKTDYGENIYFAMSTDPNAEHKASDAVRSWYDEIKLYKFSSDKNDIAKIGHFTQLVWKSTTEMSAAVASKKGTWYVVATYNPAGNFKGKFTENVLPKQ